MDEKEMQEVIEKMSREAEALDIDDVLENEEIGQIEILAAVVQNLEMGMMQLAQSQQSMGIALDSSRLTVHLLIKMMTEKEIFDEEEFKARYETDVAEKIMEMQKQIKDRLCQQATQQKAAQEEANERGDEPTSGAVVNFPAKEVN